MNGNSLLVDTNIALYLFNGDKTVTTLLNGRNIYISFITELELLGYKGISKEDREKIKDFINDSIVIELNEHIKKITIDLRIQYSLKLPDAIIAASAIYLDLPFISADKAFDKIAKLQFLKYEI